MKKISTITLHNLAVGYKNRKNIKVVAKDINAEINSGELTSLLGANGIGKSTLLRTLSAFQPQLDGKITVCNNDIAHYSELEFAKLVSVVLTDRIDLKNMLVRDLVALGRSPYTGFWGTLTPLDHKKIYDAISLVKIEKLMEREVHTLSDGEKQKVMIAKALAQDTPIILLDEPTAFLDFPSKVEVMQLLHRLSRETQKTIFLSTHDLELALQIADKVWLMDNMAQIHVGTPEDLSINGVLSQFFAQKGIIFDTKTGLFRVENQTSREVRLIGHGQLYAMIRKALQRNGISASRHIESSDSIVIQDDKISVSISDQCTVEVASIEEMLNLFS
ncbi:MAG: iron ABC transporter ATP-binding protein [Bacteroidales bacterium]|nr:MAG: iron ABC transporter ATP-binding protein [Bacteroidales bacterium]